MPAFEGQTILLTGAGGGLGQEMIRQFLQEGARLLLSDIPSFPLQTTAASLARSVSVPPDRILACIGADLSQPSGSHELASQALAASPTIDILVNNAGIGLAGSYEDVPLEKHEILMQINLLAPMRLTSLLLPSMIARRSGHIVNVSSCAGLSATPLIASYCASKFGLRGWAEALASDLRKHKIAVTTIYPYFTKTAILESPAFGLPKPDPSKIPLVYEPSFVIQKLVEGMKKKEIHVYPGLVPKFLDAARRLTPWLFPLLLNAGIERNFKQEG